MAERRWARATAGPWEQPRRLSCGFPGLPGLLETLGWGWARVKTGAWHCLSSGKEARTVEGEGAEAAGPLPCQAVYCV